MGYLIQVIANNSHCLETERTYMFTYLKLSLPICHHYDMHNADKAFLVISSLQVTINNLVKSWIKSGEAKSHLGMLPVFVGFLSNCSICCLFLRLYTFVLIFWLQGFSHLSVLSQDPIVIEQKLCTRNYRKAICSCHHHNFTAPF